MCDITLTRSWNRNLPNRTLMKISQSPHFIKSKDVFSGVYVTYPMVLAITFSMRGFLRPSCILNIYKKKNSNNHPKSVHRAMRERIHCTDMISFWHLHCKNPQIQVTRFECFRYISRTPKCMFYNLKNKVSTVICPINRTFKLWNDWWSS